jgi:hypothetical protein
MQSEWKDCGCTHPDRHREPARREFLGGGFGYYCRYCYKPKEKQNTRADTDTTQERQEALEALDKLNIFLENLAIDTFDGKENVSVDWRGAIEGENVFGCIKTIRKALELLAVESLLVCPNTAELDNPTACRALDMRL